MVQGKLIFAKKFKESQSLRRRKMFPIGGGPLKFLGASRGTCASASFFRGGAGRGLTWYRKVCRKVTQLSKISLEKCHSPRSTLYSIHLDIRVSHKPIKVKTLFNPNCGQKITIGIFIYNQLSLVKVFPCAKFRLSNCLLFDEKAQIEKLFS